VIIFANFKRGGGGASTIFFPKKIQISSNLKLFMDDYNLNNIPKVFLKILHNHIEEKKTYYFSKIEHIFYTTKISLLKI
jgi:hypothetical protein